MFTPITIEREIDDLTLHVWRFNYADREHRLYLDVFSVFKRQTKRHGWKAVESYERQKMRRAGQLSDVAPQLPDDVVDEARQKFMDGLKVGLWEIK